MTAKKKFHTHWQVNREQRACDGSSSSPASMTRNPGAVTCPKCVARMPDEFAAVACKLVAKS